MAITLNAGSGGSDIHTVTDIASGDEVQVVAIQDEGGDELVVSAAGAASVEVTAALPTGSNTIGDVTISAETAGLALAANQLAADHAVDLASEHARNDTFVESVAIGGELDDTTPVVATEGNVSPARITAQRALHANLRSNDGTELGTAGNPVIITDDGTALLVDGSAVTQPVSAASLPLPTGAATSANQLPDGHNVTIDNAAGAAAVNIQDGGNNISVDWAGTVPPIGAGTEAAALRVTMATDSTGQMTVDGTVTANQGGTWNVNNVSGTVSLPTGASTAANQATQTTALQLIDNPIVAHDALVSGSTGVNMAGARASNAISGVTQVANADATRIQADLNGVLITRPHTTLEEIITERVSDTAGTSTNFTNFSAGAAGVHNYVTTISVYNASATDGYVDFRNGSAGAIVFTAPAPAAGGSVITFPVPLKFADATAVAYDVSGALTTVYISVIGFKAQG